MSRWRGVISPELLPAVSGVYAVYEGQILMYLGSTVNLRTRLFIHRQTNSKLGRLVDSGKATIKYRPSFKYGDWAMVELRLINRLKPVLNKKSKERPIVLAAAYRQGNPLLSSAPKGL